MGNFKVYVHIFPNGKLYFGITSQQPNNRWYSNGSGYKKCPLLYKAISKYGWDNVEHLILLDNLTKECAIYLEKYFIKLFNTNNSNFGYNLTGGGEGTFDYFPDETVRKKMSNAMIGKNPLSKKVSGGGVEYPSVVECSRQLGIPQSTLSRYLRGERDIPEKFKHLDLKFVC